MRITRKLVNEVYAKQEELLKELHDLRKACKHYHYHLKRYSEDLRSTDIKCLCTDCDKVLGVPNKEEIIAFQKDETIKYKR